MPVNRSLNYSWNRIQDQANLTDLERDALRNFVEHGKPISQQTTPAISSALEKVQTPTFDTRAPRTRDMILERVEINIVQMRQQGQGFHQIGQALGINAQEAERLYNRGVITHSTRGVNAPPNQQITSTSQLFAGQLGNQPFSGSTRPAASMRADTSGIRNLVRDLESELTRAVPSGANYDYVVDHTMRSDPMGGHAVVQVYRAEGGNYFPIGEPFKLSSYQGVTLINTTKSAGWYRQTGAGTISSSNLMSHVARQLHTRHFSGQQNFLNALEMRTPMRGWERVGGDLPQRYGQAGQEVELQSMSGVTIGVPGHFTYHQGVAQPISMMPKILGRAEVEGQIYSGGPKFGKDVSKRTRIGGGTQPRSELGYVNRKTGEFNELPKQQAHIYAQQATELEVSYRAKGAIFMLSDPRLAEGMMMMDPRYAPDVVESFDRSPEKWQVQLPSNITEEEVRSQLGLTGNRPAQFRPGQRIRAFGSHTGISFGNWERATITGFDITANQRGERVLQLHGHRSMQSGGNVSYKDAGFKHFSVGGNVRQSFGLDADVAMSTSSSPVQTMTGILANLPRHTFEDYWRRANPQRGSQTAPAPPNRYADPQHIKTGENYKQHAIQWMRTYKLFLKENVDWNYVTPPTTMSKETLEMMHKAGRVVGQPRQVGTDAQDEPLWSARVKSPVLLTTVPLTVRTEMSSMLKGRISAEEGKVIKDIFPQMYDDLLDQSARHRAPYNLLTQVMSLNEGRPVEGGAPILDIEELARSGNQEWFNLKAKVRENYHFLISEHQPEDLTPERKTQLGRQAMALAVSELYDTGTILRYRGKHMASPGDMRKFARVEDVTGTLIGDEYVSSLLGLSNMIAAAEGRIQSRRAESIVNRAIAAQESVLGTPGGRRGLTQLTSQSIIEHAYGASAALRPYEVARSDAALVRMFKLQGIRDPRLEVIKEAARQGLIRETGFRSPGVNPEGQMDMTLNIVTQEMLNRRRSGISLGRGMAPVFSEIFVMAQGGDVDADRSRGMPLTRVVEGVVSDNKKLEGFEYHNLTVKGQPYTVITSSKTTSAATITDRARTHAAGEYESRLERIGILPYEIRAGTSRADAHHRAVGMGRMMPTLENMMAGFTPEQITELSYTGEQAAQIQMGKMFNTYVRQLRLLTPDRLRGYASKLAEKQYQKPLDKDPFAPGSPQANVVSFLNSFDPIAGTYRGSDGFELRHLKADSTGEFWKSAAGQVVGAYRDMILQTEGAKNKRAMALQVAALLTPDLEGQQLNEVHKLVARELTHGTSQSVGALLNQVSGGQWTESNAALARNIRGEGVANAVKNLEKKLRDAKEKGLPADESLLWADVGLGEDDRLTNRFNLEKGPGKGWDVVSKYMQDYHKLLQLRGVGAKRGQFWWLNTEEYLSQVPLLQEMGLLDRLASYGARSQPLAAPSVEEAVNQTVLGQQAPTAGYMEKVLGKGKWIDGKFYPNLSAAVSNADIDAWNMLQRQVERASANMPGGEVLGESVEATVGSLVQKRTQQIAYETVQRRVARTGAAGAPRLEAGEMWLETLVEHAGDEYVARTLTPFVRTRRTKDNQITGVDFIRMTTSMSGQDRTRGAFLTARYLQEAFSRGMQPYLSSATKFGESDPETGVRQPLEFARTNLKPSQIRYQDISPDDTTKELIKQARGQMQSLHQLIRPGKDLLDKQTGQLAPGQGFTSNQQQFVEAVLWGGDLDLARSLLKNPADFEKARSLAQDLQSPIEEAANVYTKRMLAMTGKETGWRSFDDEGFKDVSRRIIEETRQKWLGLAEKSLPHILPIMNRLLQGYKGGGYRGMQGLIRQAADEMVQTGTGQMARMAKGGMSVGPQHVIIGDNPSGVEFVVPAEKVFKLGGGKLGFDPQLLGRGSRPMEKLQGGSAPEDWEQMFFDLTDDMAKTTQAGQVMKDVPPIPPSDVPVGIGGGAGTPAGPGTIAATPGGAEPGKRIERQDNPEMISFAQPLTAPLMARYRSLFEFERSMSGGMRERVSTMLRSGEGPRKGTQLYRMSEEAGKLYPRMLGQYRRAQTQIYLSELQATQERGVTPGMRKMFSDVRGQVQAALPADVVTKEMRQALASSTIDPEMEAQILETFKASDAGQASGGRIVGQQFSMLAQQTRNRALLDKQVQQLQRAGAIDPTQTELSKRYSGMFEGFFPELAAQKGTLVRGVSPHVRDAYGQVRLGAKGEALRTYMGGEHPAFLSTQLEAQYGEGLETLFPGGVARQRRREQIGRMERLGLPAKPGVWAGPEAWTATAPGSLLSDLSQNIAAQKLQGDEQGLAIQQWRQQNVLGRRLGKFDQTILRQQENAGARMLAQDVAEQARMDPASAFAGAADVRGLASQAQEASMQYYGLAQERRVAIEAGQPGRANQLGSQMNELAGTIKAWNEEAQQARPVVKEHVGILKDQNDVIKETLTNVRQRVSTGEAALSGIETRLKELTDVTPESPAARQALQAERQGLSRRYSKIRRQVGQLQAQETQAVGQQEFNQTLLDELQMPGGVRTPGQVRPEATMGTRLRGWYEKTLSPQNLFYGLQNVQQMQYMFQMPLEQKRQEYLSYEFARGQMQSALGAGGVTPDIQRFQSESAAMTDFGVAFGAGVNRASPKAVLARAAMSSPYGEEIAGVAGAAGQWGTTALQTGMIAYMLGGRPEHLLTAGKAIGGRMAMPTMQGVGQAAGAAGLGTLLGGAMLGGSVYNAIRPEGRATAGQIFGMAGQIPGLALAAGLKGMGLMSDDYARAITQTPLGQTARQAMALPGLAIGQATGADWLTDLNLRVAGRDPAVERGFKQPEPGDTFFGRLRGIESEGYARLSKPAVTNIMRSFGEATGVTARELDENIGGASDLLYRITTKLLDQGLDPDQIDQAVGDFIAKAPQAAGFMAGGKSTMPALQYLGGFDSMLNLQNRMQATQAVGGAMQFAGIGMGALPQVSNAYIRTAQNQGLFAAQRQLSALTGGTAYDFSDLARRTGQAGMQLMDESGMPMYQTEMRDISQRQSAYDFQMQQSRGQEELGWMRDRMQLETEFWDFRMANRQKDFDLGQKQQDLTIRQMELNLSRQEDQFKASTEYQGQQYAVQRQIFDLQTTQQREAFGIQRDRMGTQRRWQVEDFDTRETRMEAQRGWQLQDFSTNRNVFEMQQGWQMEDFDRAIRFASGRQRLDLMRQRERSSIMGMVKRDEMDVTEARASIQHQWGQEDLGRDRRRAGQQFGWNVEDLDRAIKNFEDMRALQSQLLDLSQEYWKTNVEFQEKFGEEQRALQREQIELMKERQADSAARFPQETALMEAQRAFEQEQGQNRLRRAEEDLAESQRREEERLKIFEWQQQLTEAQQTYSMIQQQGWDYAAQRSQEVLEMQREMSNLAKGQGKIDEPLPATKMGIHLPVIQKARGGPTHSPTLAMLSEYGQTEYVVPSGGALVMREGSDGGQQVDLLRGILSALEKIANQGSGNGQTGESVANALGKMFGKNYRLGD